MNPQRQIREKRRGLQQANKQWPIETLLPVPEDQWPDFQGLMRPIRVFRSREFLVQIFRHDHPDYSNLIRLSIVRTNIDRLGRWDDKITWDELQWIKDSCGYAEYTAVEIFPPKKDIVNVSNMRYLWISLGVPIVACSLKDKPLETIGVPLKVASLSSIPPTVAC